MSNQDERLLDIKKAHKDVSALDSTREIVLPEVDAFAKAHLQKPYSNDIESMLPLLGAGKATINLFTREMEPLESNGIQFLVSQIQNITSGLTVGAHKIYSVAAAFLRNQNDSTAIRAGKAAPNYRVLIPLDSYLRFIGCELVPKDETAKARKKAADAKNNAIRTIEKDLNVLKGLQINRDNKQGKPSKRTNGWIYFFSGGCHIEDNYIYLAFGVDVGDILLQAPITQYPLMLLRIDARNELAYQIGNILAYHAYMDQNRLKRSNHVLKVENILKKLSLITYEELKARKDTRHWKSRIKAKVEKALEYLHSIGILKDYYYRLSDEEATNFTSYTEWSQTYIVYYLEDDKPDDIALKEIEERRNRRKEKAAATRAKRKKKTSNSHK